MVATFLLPPPPLLDGIGPLTNAALFLDFDGTLVEIAARPDAVAVPAGLPDLLRGLSASLGGALAVISGRSLGDLDRFLPVPIAMAGDHGAAFRPDPDALGIMPALPIPPSDWRAAAAALAANFPGALIEDKAHGFVLHYRQAPEAGPPARTLLAELVAEVPEAFTLLEARMAWEVRPRGPSKGSAVRDFMARVPFRGRAPVFVGDDVTDEEGMAAARQFGGWGWRLDEAFGTPSALRDWLARAAAGTAAERAGGI